MKRNVIYMSMFVVVWVAATSAWATDPPTDPGPTIELTATPHAPGALSEPGWDVTTYPMIRPTEDLTEFKGNIAALRASGFFAGHATGEPDINYDGGGVLLPDRLPPGYRNGTADQYWGLLAKGWIQFTQEGYYSIGIIADDMAEVAIGDQVLFTSNWTQVGGNDINGGVYQNLHVDAAHVGIYPIQFLFFQSWGGAGVDFYRRIGNPDSGVAIGASDGGLTDQPIVYGLLDADGTPTPAPDLVSTYTPVAPRYVVNLDPGQKVGDVNAGTGEAKFSTKTHPCPLVWYSPSSSFGQDSYWGPYTWENLGYQWISQDWWDVAPMKFLDFFGDQAPGGPYKYGGLNFCESGSDGLVPGGVVFPPRVAPPPPGGFNPNAHFQMRAEGFATFPTAGDYYLGMYADDAGFLRIGNQAIEGVYPLGVPHSPSLNQVMYYADGGSWNGQVFVLHVTTPGTYPICVDYYQWMWDFGLELFQLTSAGPVAVGGPGSDITVHESATSGPYAWASRGTQIPADRKVADSGEGGISGWDATLVHIGPSWPAGLSGGMTSAAFATLTVENDMWGAPVQADSASAYPVTLDYGDPGSVSGHAAGFAAWNDAAVGFSNAAASGNNAFGMSAVGYIEFPAAGDYGFNAIVEDESTIWIGGKIVHSYPRYGFTVPASWINDGQFISVHVDASGIYDIRLDFAKQVGTDGPATLEFYQYLPDGSQTLVNGGSTDPMAVKVFRTLAGGVTPDTTTYHNPVRVPLSAKVADMNKGLNPGLHCSLVQFAPASGDRDPFGGIGHETFWSIDRAVDLLNAVVPPGNSEAQLKQQGRLVYDGHVDNLVIGYPDHPDWENILWPGGPDYGFSCRFSGYIALQQGGHNLAMRCDSAWSCTIGGMEVGRLTGVSQNMNTDMMYVYVPASGLYPIEIVYLNAVYTNGTPMPHANIRLQDSDAGNTDYWLLNHAPVGAQGPGPNTMLYESATICPTPFADADKDHDVDQGDFGAFQSCYTGPGYTGTLVEPCSCFDVAGGVSAGSIDAEDYNAFMNCWSGPAVVSPCQ